MSLKTKQYHGTNSVQPTSIHLGVPLAQLEPQGAAGGLALSGAWGRRGRDQDGANLSAEWVDLTAT